MVILIAGASHTGKTALAQRLLERYHCPYLSIDHMKMGLIRSGNTDLTPESSDEALTAYLWPFVREMVKTAVENGQDLIVEGCYIPADWKKDFDESYLENIRFVCIVMTARYIREHFGDIVKCADVAEKRVADDCRMEEVLADNESWLRLVKEHQLPCILIDEAYEVGFDLS